MGLGSTNTLAGERMMTVTLESLDGIEFKFQTKFSLWGHEVVSGASFLSEVSRPARSRAKGTALVATTDIIAYGETIFLLRGTICSDFIRNCSPQVWSVSKLPL